jgi:hypothetical protein
MASIDLSDPAEEEAGAAAVDSLVFCAGFMPKATASAIPTIRTATTPMVVLLILKC